VRRPDLARRALAEAFAAFALVSAGCGALLPLAIWTDKPAQLRATVPSVGAGFAPALAAGQWHDFWIYVVGPLVGATLGALAYQHVRGEH
jgi:glycerol uptake facilitator-like aquaporin